MADIYGMMQDSQKALQAGVERGKQSKLAGLMQHAMQAPQAERSGLVAQMAGVSPQAGFDAQKFFTEQQDEARAEMGRYAMAFDALPEDQKAQAYPGFAQRMKAMGLPIPEGDQYRPEYGPRIRQFASAWGGMSQQGAPAGVQEFQYFADGLSPEDATKAKRVHLGLDPRPSSAAIAYKVVKGGDGRERLVAVDPREPGAIVMGGDYGAPAPQQGGNPFASLQSQIPGLQVTSGTRTPEHNRAVGGVPNSYHLTGQAIDVVPPQSPQQAAQMRQWADANGMEWIDEGDHWHAEPRGNARQAPAGANPFVSRSPEEDAAAVENAKQGVQLSYLPQTEEIKANAAVRQAVDSERGKKQVEVDAKAQQKTRDADMTLGLLDEAEKILPKATNGRVANYATQAAGALGVSTEGAQATARLNLIAAKLVAAVPRFEGPQSNIDVQFYREAAGDLANPNLPVQSRLAALQTMRTLNRKYASGGQQEPAPSNQFQGFKVLD